MSNFKQITQYLILAVLSVSLYYQVQSNQNDKETLTELRKSNSIAIKTLIHTKKIFRVNAETKIYVTEINQNTRKRR